ncbi:MAG: SIS domain-containing protein [bacterium]|nr:SIS domain-containing protein [bacterium]
MEEAIKQFNTQFSYKPVVVHGDKLPQVSEFLVNGMGGSHLAADLLKTYDPSLDVGVYSDYGLPPVSSEKLSRSLLIASSYSGNTEETIDFLEVAQSTGHHVAAIGTGGKLIALAQKYGIPHVVIPDTKVQPRSALGLSLLAFAALLKNRKLLEELPELASVLAPDTLEPLGRKLSEELRSSVPIICSSSRNRGVAYIWKIKMNETGKIPAFYNVFPELNHNEMTGFDAIETTEGLSRKFHFIFLSDSADHPQVQKRMQVTKKLYEDRGFSVTEVPLSGGTILEKIFNSILIADWTALHLSRIYGTEAEQVPMVEEFKKLVSS